MSTRNPFPASFSYGSDPVRDDPRIVARRVKEVPVEEGMVVEEAASGFCGAVLGLEKGPGGELVLLEDRFGAVRRFPLMVAGFRLDGATVTLVKPAPAGRATGLVRSASGSVAVQGHRARVAREGRIYVEGTHDAELVEKVWGHDLRVEGVVVEPLHGVDDLPTIVRQFQPGPGRRLGVLVDHLVPGSKESRIVAGISGADVLVTGHPYVDVWEAVKPSVLGIPAWPTVPRGQDWKTGVCAALGWPEETGLAWKQVLARVRSWQDLEMPLLRSVEQLIDFVTTPE